MGKRDIPKPGVTLVMILILLSLSACVPVMNWALAGDAELVFANVGLRFDPGSEVALGVTIDVQGERVETTDDRCEPYAWGLDCRLGDVASPTVITLAGESLSATGVFRRPDSDRFYHVAAR